MEQIVIVPNVLSEEDCARLVEEINPKDESEDNIYFSSQIGSYDFGGMRKRRCVDHPYVQQIVKHFNFNIEGASVLFYPSGSFNPEHIDDGIVTNGVYQKVKPWTHTVILFLNDTFKGGHLIYPNQGIELTPKTGMMVVSPAGIDFPHEVTTVVGDRYVLVMRLI